MIVIAPEKIPATPSPAMARPMMRVVEFGATPHINEPNSKITTAAMKNHLMENDWYSFPQLGCNEHEVKK